MRHLFLYLLLLTSIFHTRKKIIIQKTTELHLQIFKLEHLKKILQLML